MTPEELKQKAIDRDLKYIVFDLETAELPVYTEIVQTAVVLLNSKFQYIGHMSEYSFCDKISAGAVAVHKITTDFLRKKARGYFEDVALGLAYLLELPNIEIVGQNILFDLNRYMYNIEHLTGLGKDIDLYRIESTLHDTMYLTRDLLKLPWGGKSAYKFPSLTEELNYYNLTFLDVKENMRKHGIIVDEEVSGAHNALVDSWATAMVFRCLYSLDPFL